MSSKKGAFMRISAMVVEERVADNAGSFAGSRIEASFFNSLLALS
jgi:hypothetical protein